MNSHGYGITLPEATTELPVGERGHAHARARALSDTNQETVIVTRPDGAEDGRYFAGWPVEPPA